MKYLFGFSALIIFSRTTFAASGSGNNLSISPIIGFERVQKFVPTPTMKTRMIYGLQALYRLPITTAELEYTHGQDTSNSVPTGTSYKDAEDKVKIGLRGNAELGPYFSTYLRGGAQARQNKHTQTTNTGTTTTATSSKVNPYVGTGIAVHFQQYLSLSADVTAVYVPTSDPALSPYEIQPSLGISVGF
jgi:hypothetical protein